MAFIRAVRVYEDETVELQWRCLDGTVFIQRITIPPKATREAQHQPPLDLDPRNAAGQVTDRSQTTAAGQRFATAGSGSD